MQVGKPDEAAFEIEICDWLLAHGGYQEIKVGNRQDPPTDFDPARGLDTVDVLRHGVVDKGVTIQLAYFKPASCVTKWVRRARSILACSSTDYWSRPRSCGATIGDQFYDVGGSWREAPGKFGTVTVTPMYQSLKTKEEKRA